MSEIDPKLAAAQQAFESEWGDLTAAEEWKPWTTGDYRGTFEAPKSKLWIAETGNVGFKACFQVVEGAYAGRRLYRDLWIQGDKVAKEMAKRDLIKLGLTPADLRNPPAIEGTFVISVKVDD